MTGIFSWITGCKGKFDNRDFSDEKFKVGQIWNYETRTGEEKSTIQILKVEQYEKSGIIIHIYVSGIKIKNTNKANGTSNKIGHLPLSKEAVLNSVITLVSENNKSTDYKDGYNNWKRAFDNNKGGIFSITIKEAVQYVEETMANGKKVKE